MNKTLRITFALKSAYKVNSILYSLKQLPLIKKLLPESLYSSKGLKTFAGIIAILWEIVSAFLGKFLYFFLMIHLILRAYGDIPQNGLFLHILFFLSIAGAFLNTYLFNPGKEKYYAVILLRMDARESTLVDYGYSMLKLFVGFFLFGTYFGTRAGVPVWLCLLAPFFVAGLKATIAAHSLRVYEKTGVAVNENLPSKAVWTLIAVSLAAAYGLPALKIVLPLQVTAAIMFVTILTGALSLRKIWCFRYYRECCQQLLKPDADQKDAVKSLERKRNDKLISSDTAITSKRRGFEYLNELFIKRHKKLLWNALVKIALGSAAVIAGLSIGFFLYTPLREPVNSFLLTNLPWFVFIMYALNRGTNFTRVLFMNCDHSLLTYSFFKQPKFVLALFRIRLREITKVNLLPACVIGLGAALLLYLSGGTDDLMNYVVLAVSIPALSVFFSVHYLMIYYLLQPYTASTELKSASYQLVLMATYLACYFIMKCNPPTLTFGALTIVFCILYSAVACLLVYKIAPKTFKLRA